MNDELLAKLQEIKDNNKKIEDKISPSSIPEENIDYSNYQVVYEEFFEDTNLPCITFYDNRFFVNSFCIKKFQFLNYTQLLINPIDKKLILKPCKERKKDSFSWCNIKNRHPSKVKCQVFFYKLFKLMDWDISNRYVCLGKEIISNEEHILLFDLNSPKIFKEEKDRVLQISSTKLETFGIPVNEHEDTLIINTFNEYEILDIPKNEIMNESEKINE